jgi:hypothetical protein
LVHLEGVVEDGDPRVEETGVCERKRRIKRKKIRGEWVGGGGEKNDVSTLTLFNHLPSF